MNFKLNLSLGIIGGLLLTWFSRSLLNDQDVTRGILFVMNIVWWINFLLMTKVLVRMDTFVMYTTFVATFAIGTFNPSILESTSSEIGAIQLFSLISWLIQFACVAFATHITVFKLPIES